MAAQAKLKIPMHELGDSPSPCPTPWHSSPLLVEKPSYGHEVSLLQNPLGSLAPCRIQDFILETNVNVVQQESDQELNEQIALGLFWANILSIPCNLPSIVYCSQPFLCVESVLDGKTYSLSFQPRASVQSHKWDMDDGWTLHSN